MPSGNKSKSKQIEVDPAALAKLDEYRVDWRRAMEELIRIRPRDKGFRTTAVIPFRLRPAQEKAWRAIQRQRALNIWQSLSREYPDRWKDALSAATRTHNIEDGAKPNVDLIEQKRPEYVLHTLHTLGYERVTDSPVLIVIIKARQQGFSTLIQVILFLYALFNPRSTALVLSSDDESVEHVLSMTATIIDVWPEEFASVKPELVGDARNRLELHNKSKYMARTSDGKRIHSITADIVHATEYAHYLKEDKVAAALVALPAHAWTFYESTSAGPSGDYYEKAKSAVTIDQLVSNIDAGVINQEGQLVKVFVSWLEDPEYRAKNLSAAEAEHIKNTLDDYERNLLERFKPGKVDPITKLPLPTCDLARLKWRRYMLENKCKRGKDRYGRMLTPEQYFMQEYPADETEAFQEASGAVFPTETLLRMDTVAQAYRAPRLFRFRDEKSMPDPVISDHLANLTIWKLPIKGHYYSIGADCGRGRGMDNTVFAVYDRLDGTITEQVAEWAYPHLSERASAHILVMLARLYNNAFVVPESNAGNKALIEEMTQTLNYHNVYFRQAFAKIGGAKQAIDTYGFETTHQSKDMLIAEMKQAMIDGTLQVYSKHAIHEMRVFQFSDPTNPKSPMNAREGEHDDRVIATALAYLGTKPNHGAPLITVDRRPSPTDDGNEGNSGSTPEGANGMSPWDIRMVNAVNRMVTAADKEARNSRRRRTRLDADGDFEAISKTWS